MDGPLQDIRGMSSSSIPLASIANLLRIQSRASARGDKLRPSSNAKLYARGIGDPETGIDPVIASLVTCSATSSSKKIEGTK